MYVHPVTERVFKSDDLLGDSENAGAFEIGKTKFIELHKITTF